MQRILILFLVFFVTHTRPVASIRGPARKLPEMAGGAPGTFTLPDAQDWVLRLSAVK